MIESGHSGLTVKEQCALLELPRCSYYREPLAEWRRTPDRWRSSIGRIWRARPAAAGK